MSLGESAWYRRVRAASLSGVRWRLALMLMSVISRSCELVAMPELSGARVLITGLTSACGFDVARAFADHGARLIIQSPEDSQEMTELTAVLAESASEIRLFNDPLQSDAEAVR